MANILVEHLPTIPYLTKDTHPLKVCYICSGITGADLLAYDLYDAAKKYLAGQKIRLFNGPKEPDFESNLYLLKHTK